VLFGLVLLAIGLFFAIGGGKLAALDGSKYFLIAGIVMIASAVQFMRRKASAVTLLVLAFIGTLIWAVMDGTSGRWFPG